MDSSKVDCAAKERSVSQENSLQGLSSNIVSHRSNYFVSKENPSVSFLGRMEDSSEAASNLRAFRMLFGDDEEETEDKEEFLGFDNKDYIVNGCRLLHARIIEELKFMKKQMKKPKLDVETNLTHAENIQESKLPKCTNIQGVTVSNTELKVALNPQATTLRKVTTEEVENPLKLYDLKQCSVRIAQSCVTTEYKNSGLCDFTAVMPEPPINDVNNVPPLTHENSNNVSVKVNFLGQDPADTLAASVFIDPIINEDFHGFSLDFPLRVACKSKLEKITAAIDQQKDFHGFSSAHPLRRKCIFKLEKIMSELHSGSSFSGFSVDNPLREACIAKYRQIAADLSHIITVAKENRVLLIPHKNPVMVSFSDAETETSSNDESTFFDVHKYNLNVDVEADLTTDSSSCEPDFFEIKQKVKVLIPNVKSNMSVVKKGPRIKSVRFFGGTGQKLPLSKFLPHQYPWNQSYDEPGQEDLLASCHMVYGNKGVGQLETDQEGSDESELVDDGEEEMPFQSPAFDSK